MMVQIEKIKITNRVRKEIAKIAELSEDIRANGLINPITVMSLDGGEYQLLAGLRRLRATEMLGHSEIDVNVVAPADAEAALRIEISENEQREPFTFSETVDYGRMLEEIVKAKAKERMLSGKKVDDADPTAQGREGQKGETGEIVAEKLGMGETNYRRAKYIADNAPAEIIEELDKGQRSIRGTYDELKAKEKREKLAETSESENTETEYEFENAVKDESEIITETASKIPEADSTQKPDSKTKSSTSHSDDLFSKADLEAMERLDKFNAMSDAEKVEELERQLKKERTRAVTAETELARLKEFHDNLVYHKDGIIDNLQRRLDTAEAWVEELEALLYPNGKDAE